MIGEWLRSHDHGNVLEWAVPDQNICSPDGVGSALTAFVSASNAKLLICRCFVDGCVHSEHKQ